MKITEYQTDKKLELEGTWVEIRGGAQIKVARIGNARYDEMLRAKMKPFRRQVQKRSMSIAKQDEIFLEVVSETILLDWKHIEDVDGNTIPFTKSKALEFLTEIRDFREDVLDAAELMETFKAEEVEEDLKNSEAS